MTWAAASMALAACTMGGPSHQEAVASNAASQPAAQVRHNPDEWQRTDVPSLSPANPNDDVLKAPAEPHQ